jgi:hypothetical protein
VVRGQGFFFALPRVQAHNLLAGYLRVLTKYIQRMERREKEIKEELSNVREIERVFIGYTTSRAANFLHT